MISMEKLIVLFVVIVFLYCFISIGSLQNRIDKLEMHYADLKDKYEMLLLIKYEDIQDKDNI